MKDNVCAVGRELLRRSDPTPPCPNYGLHTVGFQDAGDGRPLETNICNEHLPEFVTAASMIAQSDVTDRCMAGRNLYGAEGFEQPCPQEGTVIVESSKIIQGQVVPLQLCPHHRQLLPEDLS